jgi:hypothetical protein
VGATGWTATANVAVSSSVHETRRAPWQAPPPKTGSAAQPPPTQHTPFVDNKNKAPFEPRHQQIWLIFSSISTLFKKSNSASWLWNSV